jgi:hypothetical protein
MRCKDTGEMNLEHHHQHVLTVAWLHDKLKADGTGHHVDKEYRRPHSTTYNGSVETVLQVFTQSVWQYCCETGVCETSVHHIF